MAWNDIADVAVAFAQVLAFGWLLYGAVLATSARCPIRRNAWRKENSVHGSRTGVSGAIRMHSGITKVQG